MLLRFCDTSSVLLWSSVILLRFFCDLLWSSSVLLWSSSVLLWLFFGSSVVFLWCCFGSVPLPKEQNGVWGSRTLRGVEETCMANAATAGVAEVSTDSTWNWQHFQSQFSLSLCPTFPFFVVVSLSLAVFTRTVCPRYFFFSEHLTWLMRCLLP